MLTPVQRWLAELKRRRAAVRAAREYAACATGRPLCPALPLGGIRAAATDRCYVRVNYRDGVGSGRGLFCVHDSGIIETVTAAEVRAVRKYRCRC